MRCHLFWTPLFYLYDSKNCGQSVYIGKFGLPLPWFPIYAECPHRYVRTFAIFRKTITICGRLNLSLIKQMLIYYVVCLLFYAIGGFLGVLFSLLSIFVFNRSNMTDTFSGLTSWRGTIYFILYQSYYCLFLDLRNDNSRVMI